MRSGANNVYLIRRAIGSVNKFGIISRQCAGICAGTDAVSVDLTSYSEANDCHNGHSTKNRK